MQKFAISIAPQYHKILKYLDIFIRKQRETVSVVGGRRCFKRANDTEYGINQTWSLPEECRKNDVGEDDV